MSPKVITIAIYLLATILANAQNFRLPTTIKPINYNLRLKPNAQSGDINGEERIQINITNEYFDNIEGNFDVSFHYYPGMVISVANLIVTDTDGAQIANYTLDGLDTNDTTQIATPTFNVTKQDVSDARDAGNGFVLYMVYTAQIRGVNGDDLAGWYYSTYSEGEGEDEVTYLNLVTQFQATDARSVFPCFDEPAFKATFDITFIAPEGDDMVYLSNGREGPEINDTGIECEQIISGSTETVPCIEISFATTPMMSTYLVALAVGVWDEVSDETSATDQSVFYPRSFPDGQAKAVFALGESRNVLNIFGSEDVFNSPFSDTGLDKLDSMGVSDFAAGAMENWGLVIYRTSRLLVDEEDSSQAALSGQILIIAHELAHQWFGNLVTPTWWDDLWLNEGFATFMAYYGAELVRSDYEMYKLKIQAISNVMIDDSSIFTEAVLKDIEGDPTQILSSFSSITYQKGMGIINTIANSMGIEEFLTGIRQYLSDYAFDNANSQQLGEVLDAVVGAAGAVSDVMNSHINQTGLAIVSVTAEDQGDGTYDWTLTQNRFLKIGPPGSRQAAGEITAEMIQEAEDQLWLLPINAVDQDGNTVAGFPITLSERTSATLNPGAAEYVLFNPVDAGSNLDNGFYNYFRVFYDDTSLGLIVDNFAALDATDQFLIISDRYALMSAQYIEPTDYLDFIQDVTKKILDSYTKGTDLPDYPTWNVIVQSLTYVDDIFCETIFIDNTADAQSLRSYFRYLARDILREALNFAVASLDDVFCQRRNDDETNPCEDICPEGEDCQTLQGVLIQALVRFDDRAIIDEARIVWYNCENQRRCGPPNYERNGPKITNDTKRVSFVDDDVFQAIVSAVLSYDSTDDNMDEILIRTYPLVNIEQQQYILNALPSVYFNEGLTQRALEFIDTNEEVRSNQKINAFVGMKRCSARLYLWNYLTQDQEYPTKWDNYFQDGSGLFTDVPLTQLWDTFATQSVYDDIDLFFNGDYQAERVNEGTGDRVSQTLESISVRNNFKESTESSLQLYLRQYVVDNNPKGLEIWEIILITIACCGGLILMVVAFWGISKPTDSDRMVYYMSMKREKRQRRKSSQGAPAALTSSLGHSLDRSLRTNSHQQNNVDLTEATPGTNNANILEEEQQLNTNGSNGSNGNSKQSGGDMEMQAGGYGATEAFNYSRLKEDDEQTS